ncbi:hypothetical protein F4802DRAFT_552668 [Xylaria palmicola]|nr:hypothetical protein F4802DRAFT_552668 [Xylaria palmicola]
MAIEDSRTLSPLPPVVHSGSIAIGIFGIASFFSALALLIFITLKLIRWQLGKTSGGSHRRRTSALIFANGPVEFGPEHDAAKLAGSDPVIDAASLAPSERVQRRRYPNQFMVLIVNLLIADLHQATAFALSTSWVVKDSIAVGTRTCSAQGLFVSTGDLSSSCFMSAIAIHTFYSIVYKYRPPHKKLYCYIALIWAFVYLISVLPIAGTRNGASVGGFFVRAGAWCWINEQYGNLRLLTHYLFIFIAIVLSWTLYTAIFISLRRQQQRGELVNAKHNGYHHPAFLIYPVIYLICILPLAVGRVATMAKREPPMAYFCFAGALAASNGWLDVILFTTTRRTILFAHGDDLGNEDTGVETFAFMNGTPSRFGNTIWVRGGGHDKQPARGWWRILGDPETKARQHGKSLSQTSLTPQELNAIQMEVVTTVVVEDERSRSSDIKPLSTSTSSRSTRNESYQ